MQSIEAIVSAHARLPIIGGVPALREGGDPTAPAPPRMYRPLLQSSDVLLPLESLNRDYIQDSLLACIYGYTMYFDKPATAKTPVVFTERPNF